MDKTLLIENKLDMMTLCYRRQMLNETSFKTGRKNRAYFQKYFNQLKSDGPLTTIGQRFNYLKFAVSFY